MESIFVCSEEVKPLEISRKYAKGYKRMVIEESLNSLDFLDITVDKDTIYLNKAEDGDIETAEYVLLCKEFGVFGYFRHNFMTDVTITFLDEGWMLVTIKKGALTVRENGGKVILVGGGVTKIPPVTLDNIYWINTNNLLGLSELLKNHKDKFLYDIEFYYSIGGERAEGNGVGSTMRCVHKEEEDSDISLGHYQAYLLEQQQKTIKKENEKRMKALQDKILYRESLAGDEWEDDDLYDYEEDDEEYE